MITILAVLGGLSALLIGAFVILSFKAESDQAAGRNWFR